MKDIINSYFEQLKKSLDKMDRDEITNLVDIMEAARKKQKKVFIFGNGGSAATASHFAGDMNKGVSYGKEVRHRVIALTDNIPAIMAYANDTSYDDVFVEQLKNLIDPEDVVIGISGSGNSKNVLAAIEYANGKGNITVGITGYDGGKLKKISKYSINANINDMQISEDIHMILTHLLMKLLMKKGEEI
jgi:D-sedoheptulose 7-phosphate isomerase